MERMVQRLAQGGRQGTFGFRFKESGGDLRIATPARSIVFDSESRRVVFVVRAPDSGEEHRLSHQLTGDLTDHFVAIRWLPDRASLFVDMHKDEVDLR